MFGAKQKQKDDFETMLKPNQDQKIKIMETKSPNVKRKDLKFGFSLENLLTSEECEFYLKETDQYGFKSLEKEYPKQYCNAERCVVFSKEFSNLL